jgi:phospholipid/cholesterol/gamma-HCH transport system substrate-binding protein
METTARYVLIGLFTLAVVAGGFAFVYWMQGAGGGRAQAAYRVRFENSVSGLVKGASVLFDGIRVGEVTVLELDRADPRQVIATIAVDAGTPIRTDTRIGMEFQGLMGGVAAIALTGGAPNSPIVTAADGQPPLLVASPDATVSMTAVAHEALARVDRILAENAEPLHSAIAHIDTFAEALARNSGRIDNLLAGLERMTGASPPKVVPIFDLTAPAAFPARAKPPEGLMVVPDPTAVIVLDSQKILTRSGNGGMTPMPDVQWSDNLPKLVQARIVQSFENARYLEQVARPLEGLVAGRQLLIDIRRFELQLDPNPVAHVELSAKIVGDGGRIAGARIFDATVPARSEEAAAAAAALDQAFGTIVTDLVAWTGGLT